MKITNQFECYGLVDSVPKKQHISGGYRAGRLIYTQADRYAELDGELNSAISPWLKSGLYLRGHVLVISDVQDWADFKVIQRIKHILERDWKHLPGRFVIQDLSTCIKVVYSKE